MKKKSRKKRIIIIIILLMLLAAAVAGLLTLKQRNNKAYVQLVSDSNLSWVLSDSSSGGFISQGSEQSFYLQGREQVAQVLVSPEQQVEKGDPLFRYDTQVLELQVKQSELEVTSARASLDMARQQLAAYQSIVPTANAAPFEPPAFSPSPSQQLPAPYQGEGSFDAPLTYLCRPETLLSGSQINAWIEQGQVAVLELRQDGRAEGELLSSWTIDGHNFLAVAEDSWWSVAERGEYIPDLWEQGEMDTASSYTQAEKDRMVAEQQLNIRRLENSLALAENGLEQARARLDEATVRAGISGVVTFIGQPYTSPQDGSPFCTILGSSGVTLTGYISELDLADTQVGDRVSVISWMSGESSEAAIISISDYPTENEYWYNGNPNVSYYQFTAYMESASGFEAGESVDIQPVLDGDEEAIVLERIYVRSDGEGAYMLVDDGTGRLERRQVTVAPTSYSEYVRITSGLSPDDYFAFPYGDAAKVGTATTTYQAFSLF